MPKPSRTHQAAIRQMFTEYGYVALNSVITSQIRHRTAIQTLSCLRELALHKNDAKLEFKVKQYFAKRKMMKGTDFTYLESSHG